MASGEWFDSTAPHHLLVSPECERAFPKRDDRVRLSARGPMPRDAAGRRLDCRSSGTGSIPIRGAIGQSEGRNGASKTPKEGSTPSWPATGMCIGMRPFLARKRIRVRLSASPPTLLPIGWRRPWYGRRSRIVTGKQLHAGVVQGERLGFQPSKTSSILVARSTRLIGW